MSYELGVLLYEGKAKQIYGVRDHENLVAQKFKDSLTAFNAQKKDEVSGKGQTNFEIATKIFKYLESKNVDTHFVKKLPEACWITKKLDMIPLEVVVRNVLAGSTAKKFGREEGEILEKPLTEFFYKDDDLGDPFVSDEQALFLKAAKDLDELHQLKKLALVINRNLIDFFSAIDITLVDFKLEFGRNKEGKIILGDEISPDSCRLWDKTSREKLDKDRFRRDLGPVLEGYKEVLSRIEKHWSHL